MTTPEAPALGLPGASPGDLAHADLVGRLAREIYGQGQAASQPFAPAIPAGPQVPQALESLPQGPGGAPPGPCDRPSRVCGTWGPAGSVGAKGWLAACPCW